MSARVASRPFTVAIITGTRAEFGLLRPVMHAVQKHKRLKLQVIAAGAHFLPPARTIKEVEREFTVGARVPMQIPGKTGRAADALAAARGIDGFARAYAKLKPDWVVVLGDRIEAFAAASAASIAGIAVCHIHGGDRAEGIADEAMRHAITKLSHLHCAATKLSANRIIKMGEKPEHVHVTGSPAIDGLRVIKSMSDTDAMELGDPRTVVLLHPSGLNQPHEHNLAVAVSVLASLRPGHVLFLSPNGDPGNELIRKQWRFMRRHSFAHFADHLPRPRFLALMRRLASQPDGCVIGNSSAGLIECAALGVPAIDVGPRQRGREHPETVLFLPDAERIPRSNRQIDDVRRTMTRHIRGVHDYASATARYGDGRAGPRIASLLARTDAHAPALLRKHNTY